ncbi:hypothetical protein DHD08_00015 [Arenibacter sp. H213]|nr:hypothetical protein [Arenibacter sp. H213]
MILLFIAKCLLPRAPNKNLNTLYSILILILIENALAIAAATFFDLMDVYLLILQGLANLVGIVIMPKNQSYCLRKRYNQKSYSGKSDPIGERPK